MPADIVDLTIRLQCDPQAEFVTNLRLHPEESESAYCVTVTAWNSSDTNESVAVSRVYPEDCIAVPEAPPDVALSLGLLALVGLARGGLLRLPRARARGETLE